MRGRQRAVHVEVQPLAHRPNGRLGEGSTSTERTDDVALASLGLWTRLSGSPFGADDHNGQQNGNGLYISVLWPEERRLRKKGKTRNLVVLVKPDDQGASNAKDDGRPVLHVPLQLMPRFFNIPLQASIRRHLPVSLSTAFLQPILDDDEFYEASDLDLRSFYGPDATNNGYTNGHTSSPSRQAIWREGHNISIPTKRTGQHVPFRIAMLEPACQGHLTPETRVIVSTTPYDPDEHEGDDDHVDGILDGASSNGKTHISLADFDPDAFLSSSLALALGPSEPDLTDRDMTQSVSSTSGSITPRPPGSAQLYPPSSPPVLPDSFSEEDAADGSSTRFSAVSAMGPGGSGAQQDVCWVSVGGLGRAGIFEGDWVLLRAAHGTNSAGCLAKVLAWERLDEDDHDLPNDPLLIPPTLFQALFPSTASMTCDVLLQPTPFGARAPTLPIAHSMTICRLATTEGVDKRYERAWLKSLKALFTSIPTSDAVEDPSGHRLVRRGDIFAVPVWQSTPVSPDEPQEEEDVSSDEEFESESSSVDTISRKATGLVWFKVTSLNYEPLVALEDDFRSSTSSKARAGELGCWVDVGDEGQTALNLEGLERHRITNREASKAWHGVVPHPQPFDRKALTRLRDLLSACMPQITAHAPLQLSVLVKGARGAGKKSLLAYIADQVGLNVVQVDCYDIVGETHSVTEGSLLAHLEKAKSASPSILLLDHIEALAKRSESSATGKTPAIVKVLEDLIDKARQAAAESGFPVVLAGTVIDEDAVPGELLAIFKQEFSISAPGEHERLLIVEQAFDGHHLAPDVRLASIATQTAALQAADIQSLARRSADLALQRVQAVTKDLANTLQAGLAITWADINTALSDARASYSDSIGAPKIPNVSWDDIGGLQAVKDDILDTIQLPLQHPELFAQGLKKRSGILLYGPPGTGKTLLAKAVATSCSLNFFSVKGPELLNMYIGESEANVRRVFQRARDASPCVVFMDELDSVAPKRGNQGDSGGVMDRIVSQLLAELDGMSSGGDNAQVYVLGATNRPDLLDPALLRPGRFDRMLYLSVASTHAEQLSILRALTRKFKLDPSLDLQVISEMCPFNYTGADFYALCSDAMLKAMTRAADRVDRNVEQLNRDPTQHDLVSPRPLTVQYYLATLATKEDLDVSVSHDDFVDALAGMKPSVSASEMAHYEQVQQEFKGFNIGGDKTVLGKQAERRGLDGE